MVDKNPEAGMPAAPVPAPRGEYEGQKLDPVPPADHADFVEARSLGLAAIRSRLAAQQKR